MLGEGAWIGDFLKRRKRFNFALASPPSKTADASSSKNANKSSRANIFSKRRQKQFATSVAQAHSSATSGFQRHKLLLPPLQKRTLDGFQQAKGGSNNTMAIHDCKHIFKRQTKAVRDGGVAQAQGSVTP